MAEEKLMEYLLGFLHMAASSDILKMMDRCISLLDPAGAYSRFAQELADINIGIHHKTVGNRKAALSEKTHHDHPDTVLDAVSGIHNDPAGVFKTLKLPDGTLSPTHREHHILAYIGICEFLLGIHRDLASPLAELRHYGMKYRRIVSDVVW